MNKKHIEDKIEEQRSKYESFCSEKKLSSTIKSIGQLTRGISRRLSLQRLIHVQMGESNKRSISKFLSPWKKRRQRALSKGRQVRSDTKGSRKRDEKMK